MSGCKCTTAAALEYAKQGIRFNAVAPGTIDTEMVDRMVDKEGDLRNWLLSLHQVGRFGTGEQVAAAVLISLLTQPNLPSARRCGSMEDGSLVDVRGDDRVG